MKKRTLNPQNISNHIFKHLESHLLQISEIRNFFQEKNLKIVLLIFDKI